MSTPAALAEDIAQQCTHAQLNAAGTAWSACCPAHDDQKPSLSISWDASHILLKCHTGCTTPDVVNALGRKMSDLFLQSSPPTNGHKKIVQVYPYHDAQGVVVHETVRYEPKDFFQRRPDPARPGQHIWKLTGIETVLYHLPQVLAWVRAGKLIYLLEGEKDVDAVIALGLAATCNPMGAGQWQIRYNEALRGADVVLLPDNDKAGRAHIQTVAQSLHGIAGRVRILTLPGLPEKGDCSDWIAAGGTREQLKALAEQSPLWSDYRNALPLVQPRQPVSRLTHRVATPTIVTMDSVTAKPIEWFWWPYLALGTLAMLDGDPGIGKTMLTSQLAANTSRGWPFPNQHGTPEGTGAPAHSLFLAREDSLVYTVRKRLDDIDADVSKIHYLTGWRGADDEEHDFSLDDMDVLYQALDRYHPRFVVLDPIQSYLGPKVDMHRANETRPLLNKLTVAAEAYHCLILCVRHPAKASGQSGGKAMLRGLGSVDFIGAARTGLFIEEHPTDKTLALMAMSKSNIGAKGRTQIFSKAQGVFSWAGVTRMDAEMLAGSGRGPDPQAFFEAYLWLEKRLEGGIPVPATDIEEQAEHDLDISLKVLKRAKKALGVVSRKMASGTWMWTLPSLALLDPQGVQGLQGLQGLQGPLQYLRGEQRGIPLEASSQREEIPIGQESQESQEVLVAPVVYREEAAVLSSAVDFPRNGRGLSVAHEEGDI